jgi:hypothetical protein
VIKTELSLSPCYVFDKRDRLTGIGLIMATTLENNGATVYIVGRRFEVLKNAAQDNNVRFSFTLPVHRV